MKNKLKNYEIAALVEALYNEISNSEASRGAWAYSLYYVLMLHFNKKIPNPIWEEEYNQWNIDHLYRSAISSKRNREELVQCTIYSRKVQNGDVEIEFTLSSKIDKLKCQVKKSQFELLFSEVTNRDHLFILKREVDEILSLLQESEPEIVTTLENQKIKTLWNIIVAIRSVYEKASPQERDFIETTIGAAIFYLPHPVNECFNGYLSINALNDEISGKKGVKEHIFPRKRAGKKVLDSVKSFAEFECLIKTDLRIFMYLTSVENQMTINYEGTHEDELAKLKIEKFPILSPSPFKFNHRYYKKFVRWARSQENGKFIGLNQANDLLDRFLKIEKSEDSVRFK
jgi:hypothetical protein